MNLNAIKLVLKCNKRCIVKYRRLFIFRGAEISIAKTSKCIIEKFCSINNPWNNKIFAKYENAVFCLNEESSFICNDMSIHSGCKISVSKGAKLELGSGYINNNCEIRCREHIRIGENVAIGPNVIIRDNDEHYILGSAITKPVVIGNHVWIGTRVMILKGGKCW